MEPVNNAVACIPDTNIGAPPGQEEQVQPLPAAMGTHYTGMPIIVSRWKLTPHERQAIVDGGDVYLCVFSPVMVPVMLTTDRPIAGYKGIGGPMVILTPDHPDYGMLTSPPGIGG